MASGQRNFLEQSTNLTDPAQKSDAMVSGIHNVMIGFGFAIISFILSLFIKRSQITKDRFNSNLF